MGFRNPIKTFFYIALLVALTSCGVSKSLKNRPDTEQYEQAVPERVVVADTFYRAGDNFLLKNRQGLWELYVRGNPLEIGLLTGNLTKELYHGQEKALFSEVEKIVPSGLKQKLLRRFLAWYNRKMYLYVPEEYKTEIYGLSRYASPDYNRVAPPYLRLLYLHSAHDIGHALQDLMLVGCSSFAAWGEETQNGSMIIGRNFDFYVGDEFSREKVIAFVSPEQGYPFMSVSWGGMIGVVSGMNTEGLTVTINAGKSGIPLQAKTPITLIAREILQYATNVEEAIAIAEKRDVFVSESIMVGSAVDKTAVLIEKSPDNFGVYQVENEGRLICTNHFQSAVYKEDSRNQKHIEESHSMYRYQRLEELLGEKTALAPAGAVEILRDRQGLGGKDIGYGNEKALNQLLAHHGVVFMPEQRIVWVSSNPYQLGEFVAYELDKIFGANPVSPEGGSLATAELSIPEDPFVHSAAYTGYEEYRTMRRGLLQAIDDKTSLPTGFIFDFQSKNPDFWEAYYLVGRYYYERGFYAAALRQFEKAAEREMTTVPDRETVEKYIRKSKNRSRQ